MDALPADFADDLPLIASARDEAQHRAQADADRRASRGR